MNVVTYADKIAELEAILAELRQAPADLDRLQQRVARAEELLTACREQLRGIETGVNDLLQKSE